MYIVTKLLSDNIFDDVCRTSKQKIIYQLPWFYIYIYNYTRKNVRR